MPAIDEIAATLPPGMRIEVGGAVEESAKANAALFKIFPLMFLAMLTLLMVQLQRFSTLFLVFSTAPLGLIGASFSLLAFNAPFGFNALLGLIALAGMIMRNTVILVDQIDADVASGLSRWDAIIEFDRSAVTAACTHGVGGHPRHDPAVALGVLGTDGHHHDGRPSGRDDPDAACSCRRSMPRGSASAGRRRKRCQAREQVRSSSLIGAPV